MRFGITYQFHDYKKVGVDLVILTQFVDEFGFENILNKRGTTWRKLGNRQNQITDKASAISLMQEQPSVIKRPLIDAGSNTIAQLKSGFKLGGSKAIQAFRYAAIAIPIPKVGFGIRSWLVLMLMNLKSYFCS